MMGAKVFRVDVFRCAVFALLGWLPAGVASADLATVFYLVPLAEWNDGQPKATSFLPEGTVYLYRQGSYEVGLTAKANEPIELPPGTWIWIAEAPGFISTAAGSLSIGTKSKPMLERIVWPVVPACRIALAESPGWQGIERIDFVSLDRQATYPILLAQRREVQIPAGRWLAYSLGPRGLVGITRPRTCKALESLTLPAAALAPPGPTREELLVQVELPEGEPLPDLSKLLVKLTAEDRSAVATPAAAVWNGRRGSFFFLDLPADKDRWLSVEHPELRSQRVPSPAVGGRAFELPVLLLKPRRELRVMVDYRPKRAHREAQAELLGCGPRRNANAFRGEQSCDGAVAEIRLEPGVQELRFPRLDDGQYLLHARIAGELVFGLGHDVAPYLPSEDDASPVLGPYELRELEIYGQLLVGGKPVPGEVRLQGVSSRQGPSRSFPTDDDLTYHWTFFGYRLGNGVAELPEAMRDRVDGGAWAASPVSSLLACDEEGYCRTFNVHSTFVGEGRLDLDLGRGGLVDFVVVEAASGAPVEKATVGLPRQPALYFVNGHVERALPEGVEGEVVFTDRQGRARLRLPEISSPYQVGKPGFRRVQGEVTAPDPEEAVAVRVELEPEKAEAPTGTLRGPGGLPVAGAFLLAIDSAGRRRPECFLSSEADGEVEVSKACSAGLLFVAFHPATALEVVESQRLASGGVVDLGSPPSPALVVQLRTADGQPLARTPVLLRIGGIELGPNDLLLAATRTGTLLFYLSDERGEIVLRGVDPRRGSPAVALPGESGGVTVDLSAAKPGEAIVLEVP
jgi:hypothetical protein